MPQQSTAGVASVGSARAHLSLPDRCARFGPEVYAASTEILLERTRRAVGKVIEEHMTGEPSTFVDFVDDDGHGKVTFALKCTLTKPAKNRLR